MATHESFKKNIKKIKNQIESHQKKLKDYEKKMKDEYKKKEVLQEKIEEICDNYLNYFETIKDEKITPKEMIEKIIVETVSPKDDKTDTNFFYEANGKEYIDKHKFINLVKKSLLTE